MERRVHSSIDKLPLDLQQALARMLIDNEWPDDFPRRKVGKPRYKDLLVYAMHRGFYVSASTMGRFGIRMRMLARMKQAGVIVRDVMKNLTAEKASETQKAVAEMITASTIDFIASTDKMTSKQIKEIAQAISACTQISINADKYIREQISKKVSVAAESTRKKLDAAGVDRKLIQEIIDEHLGVVKS